jgi:hypothetical protein
MIDGELGARTQLLWWRTKTISLAIRGALIVGLSPVDHPGVFSTQFCRTTIDRRFTCRDKAFWDREAFANDLASNGLTN